MRCNLIALLSLFVFVSPLHAGDGQELIFQSSFEGEEACVVFDGDGDTIDVPAVHISGDLTLNGEDFPFSQYDDAIFSLRDRVTGDIFALGNSHDQQYSVNVVAGHYDVMYSVQSPGDNVPRNIGAAIMENVALLSDQTLNINVVAYMISGDFLHNGVPFPATEFDDGVVFLDSPQAGRIKVGETKF